MSVLNNLTESLGRSSLRLTPRRSFPPQILPNTRCHAPEVPDKVNWTHGNTESPPARTCAPLTATRADTFKLTIKRLGTNPVCRFMAFTRRISPLSHRCFGSSVPMSLPRAIRDALNVYKELPKGAPGSAQAL